MGGRALTEEHSNLDTYISLLLHGVGLSLYRSSCPLTLAHLSVRADRVAVDAQRDVCRLRSWLRVDVVLRHGWTGWEVFEDAYRGQRE